MRGKNTKKYQIFQASPSLIQFSPQKTWTKYKKSRNLFTFLNHHPKTNPGRPACIVSQDIYDFSLLHSNTHTHIHHSPCMSGKINGRCHGSGVFLLLGNGKQGKYSLIYVVNKNNAQKKKKLKAQGCKNNNNKVSEREHHTPERDRASLQKRTHYFSFIRYYIFFLYFVDSFCFFCFGFGFASHAHCTAQPAIIAQHIDEKNGWDAMLCW